MRQYSNCKAYNLRLSDDGSPGLCGVISRKATRIFRNVRASSLRYGFFNFVFETR